MSFTKDDLQDGMVCHVRGGGNPYLYFKEAMLLKVSEQFVGRGPILQAEISGAADWREDLTAFSGELKDIMKITYGGNGFSSSGVIIKLSIFSLLLIGYGRCRNTYLFYISCLLTSVYSEY